MKKGDLVRVNALGAALLPEAVTKHGYLWLVAEEVEDEWDHKLFRCKSLATGRAHWWGRDEVEKADEGR